ncbi:MAG: 6-carboxytetrahydropterin synthase [Vampirovibrionales bacterium]|nr:6-carboxytetrahydropterin synthase [Vampirovibrionales bacterium]
MFETMVEKHFAAAHHLLNYKGKCERPHGHNYVVQVYVVRETLDKANISYDFTLLKEKLGALVDSLDHRDLNTLPEFGGESPSAEFIARYIYRRLKGDIPEVNRVRVYETDTQCVTYYEP